MKLQRRVASLGYGSRRDVAAMCREGRITDPQGRPLGPDARIAHEQVRLDGEPLDPPQGMVLAMHKPVGVTCSHSDAGRLVYDLLPPRFRLRRPPLSSVGRLDRDTSGLLLLTDDGALLHRIISPRTHLPKTYEAILAEPLRADATDVFAAGTLMLDGESRPLAPARLEVLDPRRARLTLTEGRYHQVRRMFAALGNRVQTLHRLSVGGLGLEGLEPGAWRLLDDAQIARILA